MKGAANKYLSHYKKAESHSRREEDERVLTAFLSHFRREPGGVSRVQRKVKGHKSVWGGTELQMQERECPRGREKPLALLGQDKVSPSTSKVQNSSRL